jgi:hypothetical protein
MFILNIGNYEIKQSNTASDTFIVKCKLPPVEKLQNRKMAVHESAIEKKLDELFAEPEP